MRRDVEKKEGNSIYSLAWFKSWGIDFFFKLEPGVVKAEWGGA